MINNGFFTIRCGPCYGTGFLNEDTHCLICKGNGLIPLEGKAEDYMDCQGCGGSGFTGFDQTNVCFRCQGIGALKKTIRPGSASACANR